MQNNQRFVAPLRPLAKVASMVSIDAVIVSGARHAPLEESLAPAVLERIATCQPSLC